MSNISLHASQRHRELFVHAHWRSTTSTERAEFEHHILEFVRDKMSASKIWQQLKKLLAGGEVSEENAEPIKGIAARPGGAMDAARSTTSTGCFRGPRGSVTLPIVTSAETSTEGDKHVEIECAFGGRNITTALAEREQLAEAIARHAAALDTVRRVGQAREGADETVYRARDALKAAETALKEAQAGEGARLAAVALGEDGGVSVADAEAAVTQAANDLSIARRTRDALDERAQREAKEVERAKEAIDKCIGAVVKTEVDVAQAACGRAGRAGRPRQPGALCCGSCSTTTSLRRARVGAAQLFAFPKPSARRPRPARAREFSTITRPPILGRRRSQRWRKTPTRRCRADRNGRAADGSAARPPRDFVVHPERGQPAVPRPTKHRQLARHRSPGRREQDPRVQLLAEARLARRRFGLPGRRRAKRTPATS